MKVLLATIMYPNPYRQYSGIFIKAHVDLLKEKYNTNSLVVTGGGSNNNTIIILKKYILFTGRLIFTSLFKNFHLIHAHFAYPIGFLTLFTKLIRRKKMVLTIHGSDINAPNTNNLIPHLLIKFTLHHSNMIIAVSQDLKLKIIKKFGVSKDKISVIDMGFNPKIFYPKNPSNIENNNIFNILFVGRLIPVKGVNFLIDALSNIKKSTGFNFKCNIVGTGKEKEFYEKMGVENSIKDQIEFLGMKTQPEIAELMRNSDVVTIPSIVEGFGLVAVESLACGTPIIASKVGGLKEIIQDGINGYSITPGKVNELEQKLILLMNDPSRISSNICVDSISRFKAELKVDQLQKIYTTLVKK